MTQNERPIPSLVTKLWPLRRKTIAITALLASVPIACMSTRIEPLPDAVDAAPLPAEVDDTDTIPCAPREVLQNVCQRCHKKPPIRGAPFPLVTRSNIVRVGEDGEIRLLMIQQLTSRRMPLFPETIDDESRATLLAWLQAGAPADSPHECTADAGDGGADAADARNDDASSDSGDDGAGPGDAGDFD